MLYFRRKMLEKQRASGVIKIHIFQRFLFLSFSHI